jgi:hypothetical protein
MIKRLKNAATDEKEACGAYEELLLFFSKELH